MPSITSSSVLVCFFLASCRAQFFPYSYPETQVPACTEAGFFRLPGDCTKFYRCVDVTGDGNFFQAYGFDCPAGTVFDEDVSVCNFPWAAAPCEEDNGGEDNDVTIVSPAFSFLCTAPGFFEHRTDCQRFWLCKQEQNKLTPELYRCPEGFEFSDASRRCVTAEDADCSKEADLGRIAIEPQPIQLRLQDLEPFFRRYSYFK